MFPQLRQRIGPALDLVVEFSTLGEYRLDADGVLCPSSALALATERAPQLGGAGDSVAARAAVRRIVAGGAVGLMPAATPAARRAVPAADGGTVCRGERRHGSASPAPAVNGQPLDGKASPLGGKARPLGNALRKARPRMIAAPEQLCLAV
jgi:hypothetical protein